VFSLIFAGKDGAYQSGLHSIGRLLTLPLNIRQVQKRMLEENTLAFYDMSTFTVVKSLVVQALGALFLNDSLIRLY
jgi:hypothetical protein